MILYTQSNNEGVQRVINADGNYAFLMESNSIQYQIGKALFRDSRKQVESNLVHLIAHSGDNTERLYWRSFIFFVFYLERHCDLIQVGGLLDSKGYGIAFTPGTRAHRKSNHSEFNIFFQLSL